MIKTLAINQNVKLVIILCLALAIRLVGITSRPIWYDEAFSPLLSEQGPAAILQGTLAINPNSSSAEEHPPAYYFTLWGWMKIFGGSLVSIRMLSVVISLGILFYIYLIALQLCGPPVALTAAVLCAILPFQVHFGQEIRMYGFLTFWLCMATYAMLKRNWVVFSIAAALAQYTHTLAAFYLIPLALTPLFKKDWKTLRDLSLAGFAAIILYIPWLIHIPAQLSKVTSNYWIEKPGFYKLFTLLLMYLPHLPVPSNYLLPSLFLSTLVVSLAAFQTYKTKKVDPKKARTGLWLAYLSFAHPLLLWIISQFWPIYLERALLPSNAIFCIWLAWAFIQTRVPRPIQIAAFAMILSTILLGLYQHVTYRDYPYGPFANLDQILQTRLEKGDVILHSNKLTYLPALFFDRSLPQSYIIDRPGSPGDTLSPATRKILNLNDQDNIQVATTGATRVWYIVFQDYLDEFNVAINEIPPDIDYLDSHFKLISIENLDDLRLYLYTR